MERDYIAEFKDAIISKDSDTIKYLVDNNLIQTDNISENILRTLIEVGNLEIVKLLFNILSEEMKDFCFVPSIYRHKINIFNFLVEKGGNIKNRNDLFLLACYNGNFEIVKILVENNADVRYKDNQAVISVIERDCFDIATFLIENNADVFAQNNRALLGYPNPNISRIEFLVKYGADVTIQNNILMYKASTFDNLPLMKYLLSKGANFSNVKIKHKIYFIKSKFYKRWRMFFFKNWFRKVVIPLYYSPGFSGNRKDKEKIKKELK